MTDEEHKVMRVSWLGRHLTIYYPSTQDRIPDDNDCFFQSRTSLTVLQSQRTENKLI